MSKFVTAEGLEKLKKELEYLKTTKQKELSERLRKAIAFGDLSENFDYHDAKEQQEMLQRRIAELEEEIHEAKVVDPPAGGGKSDKVQIGSTVMVGGFNPQIFKIVTASEADPLEGKISAESPIGSSILGKKVGDVVQCETPDGNRECKIVKID